MADKDLGEELENIEEGVENLKKLGNKNNNFEN